jgi:outer membrane protein TolC
MKKRTVLTLLIIAVMLFSNVTYADEGLTLDVEKTAGNIIKNSSAARTMDTNLNNLAITLNSLEKSPYSYASPGGYRNLLNLQYQINSGMRSKVVQDNAMRVDAYSKYVNLLKSQYAVELQKQVVSKAEQSYNSTQLKYKLGQASKDALDASQEQYSTKKLQLQINERQAKGLLSALNAQMGAAVATQYTSIIDSNMIPSEHILSLEEYAANALENRAEVLNAREQLEMKLKEKDFINNPNSNNTNPDYLQVEYDIASLQTQLENSGIDVQLDLIGIYDKLKSAMSAMDNAKTAMDTAQQDYNSVKLKYKLGTVSQLEQDNAELIYLQSRNNYRTAQLDAWLMQVQMRYSTELGLHL